uniref:Uncharacterized protein n=1 Tax=Romanomermis culicivorax TaxID=13658 RepID=A0A915IVU9_ROMCU
PSSPVKQLSTAKLTKSELNTLNICDTAALKATAHKEAEGDKALGTIVGLNLRVDDFDDSSGLDEIAV